MKKRAFALLLAAAAVFALVSCARRQPGPPPDLTGGWIQPGENEWCHIARITEDRIDIWWYIPARSIYDLYWSGSFTPPTDDQEPYTWESVNAYTPEALNLSPRYNRTSREETKSFTYQDGKIGYIVTAGHLQMGYVLERLETSETSGGD